MLPGALLTLGGVLDAMREHPEYPGVLSAIAAAIARHVPCDRVTLYLRSRRRGVFLPAADHGSPGGVAQAFAQRGFGADSFAGAAGFAGGRSILGVRGEAGPEMQQLLEEAGLHSLLVVPLLSPAGAEAALACGRTTAPVFDATQLDALEELAPHLELLVRHRRGEVEQVRLAERRRVMASQAAAILAAADLGESARLVCETARSLFRTTRSALFLLEGSDLVPIGAAGPYGDHVRSGPLHLPPGTEPAFDEVLRTGEVLVLNELQRTRWAETPVPLPFRPRSALIVPLRDAAGSIGVLCASDLDEAFRFGPPDADDARILGGIAVAAIRRGALVEELEATGQLKDQFLANVSHELRTPVNVLLGYTQLLGEGAFGPLSAAQAETLERMERCARSQLAVVNDLLDLASIEQGKVACFPRLVPLLELADPLRELMELLLRDRPIRFELAIDPGAVAFTDGARLHQILLNVLGNAVKFTEQGVIRLDVVCRGAMVELAVSDSGEGFEPEFASRALEPFVRGRSKGAGSGLGLAIVARLLRLLNGEVAIESVRGTGTTVRIRLPRTDPAAAQPSLVPS